MLAAAGTACLLTLTAAAVGAQGADDNETMELPDTALGKYAAFSKLEANLAEMTAGTFLGFVMEDGVESAFEVDDPAEDIAAAEAYVARLEGMNLSDDERAALDAFKERWSGLMTARDTLMDEGPNAETLSAYWEEVNAIDEIMDDALEGMLVQDPGMN